MSHYLLITTYSETVDKDQNLGTLQNPWYKVVPGMFQVERSVFMGAESRNLHEFLHDGLYRNRGRFKRWVPDGLEVWLQPFYGIRSYQSVRRITEEQLEKLLCPSTSRPHWPPTKPYS